MPGSKVRLPELLEGPRIVLRRWRVGDAEAVARAVAESTEHLRPWMEWISQEPMELEHRRALIAHWEQEWAAGGDVVMGAFMQERVVGGSGERVVGGSGERVVGGCGERVVGGCGLHRRIGRGGLEIGYWIHPAFIRQGLATEAAALLTEGAFSVPGIDRVEIHHDRANLASEGVPRKLGFTFQGEAKPQTIAPAGVGVDCVWRINRADWQERRGARPATVRTP